jgi:branched-chain amino acid transport system permease protein
VTVALRRSSLLRSLLIVTAGGLVLFLLTETIGDYNDLQLATGAYYFMVLAGLTVLIGDNGQISIGHGGLMCVGAYTVALLVGTSGNWSAFPALVVAALATAVVGFLVGAAATRLRGPYLAGVTLAFAIAIPSLADKFPSAFGGENGRIVSVPTPPSWASSFSLEHWEAWIACAGALVVMFLMWNLRGSGTGRTMRAVRDDEISASLCGLHVARTQTTTFVISAACAGLGGGMLALVLQLAQPGAFPVQLSLSLLTAVVLGGLGSLFGAIWGAALLVLLPGWTNDIAHSFSLSQNVSANLPLAIYGVILIAAILVWPSGIQGGVRALGNVIRGKFKSTGGEK